MSFLQIHPMGHIWGLIINTPDVETPRTEWKTGYEKQCRQVKHRTLVLHYISETSIDLQNKCFKSVNKSTTLIFIPKQKPQTIVSVWNSWSLWFSADVNSTGGKRDIMWIILNRLVWICCFSLVCICGSLVQKTTVCVHGNEGTCHPIQRRSSRMSF